MSGLPLTIQEKAMVFDTVFSEGGYYAFEILDEVLSMKKRRGNHIDGRLYELLERIRKAELR
jgi:hypothetical protein